MTLRNWVLVVLPIAVVAVLVLPIWFLRSGLALATFVATEVALIMATVAAVLALLAYRSASRRPKLRLEIRTWLARRPGPFLAYEQNEYGHYFVGGTRPFTEWDIILHNDGTAPARFPVIFLTFYGLHMTSDKFDSHWRPVLHANGLGWYAFEWIGGSDVIVYPGLPLKLPRVYLRGATRTWHESGDQPALSWTLAADGFGPKTTKMLIGSEEDARIALMNEHEAGSK